MKKLFVVLALVLMATVAMGQTWYTANQITVAWDPVAKVVTTDTIKYQVYTKSGVAGTPVAVGAEITATQLAITFSVEGRYFVGVRAIRYPVGETVGIPSAGTSWSNIAADCAAAGPFGAVYYVAPGGVGGLRIAP